MLGVQEGQGIHPQARVAQEWESKQSRVVGKSVVHSDGGQGGREPRADSTNTDVGLRETRIHPRHGLVQEVRAKCGEADPRIGLPEQLRTTIRDPS